MSTCRLCQISLRWGVRLAKNSVTLKRLFSALRANMLPPQHQHRGGANTRQDFGVPLCRCSRFRPWGDLIPRKVAQTGAVVDSKAGSRRSWTGPEWEEGRNNGMALVCLCEMKSQIPLLVAGRRSEIFSFHKRPVNSFQPKKHVNGILKVVGFLHYFKH